MSVPGNGTVNHTPNNGTPMYQATVNNGTLTAHYMVEGIQVDRAMAWDDVQHRWQRTTPSIWQRIYTPANPPTTPPSGSYVVRESTFDGFVTREAGLYNGA